MEEKFKIILVEDDDLGGGPQNLNIVVSSESDP